jgi:hypothetical protein
MLREFFESRLVTDSLLPVHSIETVDYGLVCHVLLWTCVVR